MSKRKTYDDKMKLDMPADEALERFIGTDPKEVEASIKRAKKKVPPGGKKKKTAKPSDDNVAGDGVVSLRQRRMQNRNGC